MSVITRPVHRRQTSDTGESSRTARQTQPTGPDPQPAEPVAVTLDLVGGTLADYDALVGSLQLTPRGPALPGCLFHWVRATPDGIRISEVWGDRRSFDFYLREEILPMITYRRLADPEISIYPVHSYLVNGPAGLPPRADS